MLPKVWVWTSLGAVTDTTRIRVKPREEPGLRFIGMEHVEAHTMRLLGTASASEMRSSAESFAPGDVLYGRLRPYLNKVYAPDFEGLCSAEFIVFRRVPEVYPKYLQFFLNSWAFVSFASHLDEGDRPRVSFSQLAAYPLPLPPLPEQRRIVAEIETQFTRLDAAVAALKRVQARLRRYKACALKAACEGRLVPTEADLARAEGRDYEPASVLLKRILAERRARWEAQHPGKRYEKPEPTDTSELPELPKGWAWTLVGSIGDVSGGLTKNQKRTRYDVQVPYLRVANVYANELRLDSVEVIGVQQTELDRITLQAGDLLVVEGNGSFEQIGRVAIWTGAIRPCVHQNHLIKVRFAPVELARYVLWWLLSNRGREYITRLASSTSGLYTLSLSKVSALPVPLPPSAEQQRIVAEVERRLSVAQELERQVEVAFRRADRLRQSILKGAFEGRLVPQDPSDEPAAVLLARIRASRQGTANTKQRQPRLPSM